MQGNTLGMELVKGKNMYIITFKKNVLKEMKNIIKLFLQNWKRKQSLKNIYSTLSIQKTIYSFFFF